MQKMKRHQFLQHYYILKCRRHNKYKSLTTHLQTMVDITSQTFIIINLPLLLTVNVGGTKHYKHNFIDTVKTEETSEI